MLTKDQLVTPEKLKELESVAKDDRLWPASMDALPRQGVPAQAGAKEWQVVFRPPTRQEWALFKQQTNSKSEQNAQAARESLARDCAVLVVGDEGRHVRMSFDALLDRWPGIPESVFDGLAKIAGFDAAISEK